MTIEKSTMFPGTYEAFCKINGHMFVGTGKSHSEALDSIFEKIHWFMDTGKHLVSSRFSLN